MPYQRERERDKLRDFQERARDQGELREEAFPSGGNDPSPAGINPRRVAYTIVVDERNLIGFGTIGNMRT